MLSGRRVLIADAQPDRAAGIAAALREAGCEVLGPAASIDAALAELERAGAVDAAVLPATLQGISVQLLRQALNRRSVATLQLAVQGNIPLAADAAELLLEPSTSAELRRALAMVLAAHPWPEAKLPAE